MIAITHNHRTDRHDVTRDGTYLGSIENCPAGSSEWVIEDQWGGVSSITTDRAGALRELSVTDAEMATLPPTLDKVYRQSDGEARTLTLTAPDGKRFDITRRNDRAPWSLAWADPEVWANPEAYGMQRWYCPGHNGAVCQYGACDEIRYTSPVPSGVSA